MDLLVYIVNCFIISRICKSSDIVYQVILNKDFCCLKKIIGVASTLGVASTCLSFKCLSQKSARASHNFGMRWFLAVLEFP